MRSNDVCRPVGPHQYLDVYWSPKKNQWRAMVRGKSLGYWPTRRRAKKAAKKGV